MTSTADLPQTFERSGRADEVRGRLEVLSAEAANRNMATAFASLERQAERAIGRGHPTTLDVRRARILAEAPTTPVAETARAFDELFRDCLDAGDPGVAHGVRQRRAQFLRQAGHPGWREAYEEIIGDVVERFGPETVKASVARSNYTVARCEMAQDPELEPESRDALLREAFTAAAEEWRWRRESLSDDNPFTQRAAAIYVNVCLTAAYLDRPIESPDRLLSRASEVVQARETLLGAASRQTIVSRIAHAEALTGAGLASKALWRLHVLQTEAASVVLENPERLPTAVCRALMSKGTEVAEEQAAHYRAEASHVVDLKYGPESRQARWTQYLTAPR